MEARTDSLEPGPLSLFRLYGLIPNRIVDVVNLRLRILLDHIRVSEVASSEVRVDDV